MLYIDIVHLLWSLFSLVEIFATTQNVGQLQNKSTSYLMSLPTL